MSRSDDGRGGGREAAPRGGRASREKGKRGEREAAALLRCFSFEAIRSVQYNGRAGPWDVTCPELERMGFGVEVKNTQRAALAAWLEQAESSGSGLAPLILWKRPRKGWVAVLPAERALELLRVYRDAGRKR